MRILFVADIVGKPGRRATESMLPDLRAKLDIDVVVANGENLAGGYGVTPPVVRALFNSGVDVITSGNHIWDRREGVALLDEEEFLLRPANYPPGTPGNGSCLLSVGDSQIGVVNLQGRVFMTPIDDPFRVGRTLIDELRSDTNVIVVDFHAEATAEKQAFAHYVDGVATAVVGTHTHVPTADARILPGGTAFVTDLGMTGSHAGVIGFQAEKAIQRTVSGRRVRFELASGQVRFQGALVEADPVSGRAVSIESIDIERKEE